MKAIKFWIHFAAVLFVLTFAQSAIAAEKEVSPVGVWEGKWDGTWKIRYTISAGKDGAYKVIYEWEENIGQAMSKETNENARLKDGVLKDGPIDIKFMSDGSALATGHFKQPRTAILKKKAPGKE